MEGISSPELLRELWEKYSTHYKAKVGRKPSKRNFCSLLDLDGNAMSKWMTPDTPNNRRVPAERIPQLAEAMLLGQRDADKLMAVRLKEMSRGDKSMSAAIKWVVDATRRNMARRHALTEDEKHVLACYRLVEESWPRGLYRDDDETVQLVSDMQDLLKRAEALHAEEASADPECRADLKTKAGVLMAKLGAAPAFGKGTFAFKQALSQARAKR